jgi:hypothetical protein
VNRRRSNGGTAVSFFAFQDVMLGVIGVVILITIMLLIQRATSTFDDIAQPINDPVTHQLKATSETIVVVRETSPAIKADRSRKTRAIQIELDESKFRVIELQRAIRSMIDDRTLSSDHSRIASLMVEASELQNELGQLERRNRVTYLLSESEGLRPLIVELAKNRGVVSREYGSNASISITGESPTAAASRILAFLTAELGKNEYILLVVKPSGIPVWAALTRLPGLQGKPIGLDLLPEHAATTDPFPGGNR